MNNRKLLGFFLAICFIPLLGQQGGSAYNPVKYGFGHAVALYNNGNYEQASRILDNLTPDQKRANAQGVAILSMKLKYYLEDYLSAQEIGQSFLKSFPESKYLKDVYITYGDIFIEKGQNEAAFRMYLNAYKTSKENYNNEQIERRILYTLQLNIPINTADEQLAIESDNGIRNILLLAKAHTQLSQGLSGKSTKTLAAITSNLLSQVYLDYYNKLKSKVLSSSTGQVTVGVILPLTGEDEEIGREFLAGLKYAIKDEYLNGVELSFVIKDNKSNKLESLKALKSFAVNPEVKAIIGPFSNENSFIAGSFAGSTDVPILLPTATTEGLAKVSHNIFQMNSDKNMRGRAAAEVAAEYNDFENIAILAPSDEFGQNLVNAFVNELKVREKTPAIIEWYSGKPENLERQLMAIRQKGWELMKPEVRDEIINNLVLESAEERGTPLLIADIDSTHIAELTEDDSASVEISIFDAIYLPIRQDELEYVGAQFPAYNIDAVVIGNENWSDMNALNMNNIGPHLIGMIVITNNTSIGKTQDTIDLKNHTIQYYLAKDCFNLLSASISSPTVSRQSLQNNLAEIEDFEGFVSNYTFNENPENVNTSLNIIEFNGYSFSNYIRRYNLNQFRFNN